MGNDEKPSGKDILTDSAKLAIRNYMIKTIALPSLMLMILTGFGGFYLHDVVKQEARYDAFNKFQSHYIDALNKASQAVAHAETIQNDIKQKQDALESIFTSAKNLQTTIESRLNSINFSKIAGEYLCNTPKFRQVLFKDVNSKTESLYTSLSEVDERISTTSKRLGENLEKMHLLEEKLNNNTNIKMVSLKDTQDTIKKDLEILAQKIHTMDTAVCNIESSSRDIPEVLNKANKVERTLGDFMACYPFSSVKFGTEKIGQGDGHLKTTRIAFKKPFNKLPKVIVTPRGSVGSDTFSATTHNIDKDGFSLNVFFSGKSDTNQNWGQDLYADWMAFESK